MATMICSLGIRSLLLRSSRLLPVASIPKLSYSTSPIHSQTESLSNIALQLVEEIKATREDARTAYDRTQVAQEKTQKLLEERAELIQNMTNLKRDALEILEQKLRIERNFNARGALERIAYNAYQENKITCNQNDGVQIKLNAIAQLPDFQIALQDVVSKRKLVLRDVTTCIKTIYHELSKHAHGNQDPIILNSKDYTKNELAAFIAFLEVQKPWSNPLKWNIEEHEDGKAPNKLVV